MANVKEKYDLMWQTTLFLPTNLVFTTIIQFYPFVNPAFKFSD